MAVARGVSPELKIKRSGKGEQLASHQVRGIVDMYVKVTRSKVGKVSREKERQSGSKVQK